MAITVDIFDTRTMLAGLEERKPPKTFLRNMFFNRLDTSENETVDIDVFAGKRRMAPFVSHKMKGKVVEEIGFVTKNYKPPYIKISKVTSAQDLLTRAFNQNMYIEGGSLLDRAQIKLGKDLRELDELVTRREEWMCAQLMATGKYSVAGDGTAPDVEIDFVLPATHKVTNSGGDNWDNAAGKPVDDLTDAKVLTGKDSGIKSNKCIMNSNTYKLFYNNAQVKELLNIRRIESGALQMQIEAANAMNADFKGDLFGFGEIWVYDEYYWDEGTTSEKPMIADNVALIGNTQARSGITYGAINDLDAPGGLAAVQRFPKSWTKPDPSVRMVLMQSAPLVNLHQVNAFYALTVKS